MSSSLARTRSLRKPTQGSSTDLPPTTTTISSSSSASITAARGPASSTAGGGGGGGGGGAPSASAPASHRPVSPSRLPAPRSLAATRPTTRTVSGASIVNSTVTATTASEAPKKKRPNPLSSLLSRSSSTRQPASATTSTSTRQRDVTAGAGGGGGSTSSGPTSAPLSRTSALSGLTRTSSTREPGLTRTRYPANASTSNLSLVSSSNATAAGRTGAGSGPSTPTTARPTTSGGLPSSRRAGVTATTSTAAGAGSPTKGHARAKSVATLNNTTVLRPPSQLSSSGAAGPAPRSRPTSLYGAPPTSSYPSSTASTTTRPRPPSATDRLSSKPSVSSLSSTTTTTSTRTARAGSTTTAPPPPPRQPLKQPQKPPQSHQAAPPHLARQQAQQRHPSPTSPPRTTKPVLRPAFSTLQQHYSPAKSLAPKPLTATYLAAPSPSKLPANIALTAETSRLQTELLQLHLLHRDLPQVTSQWHASARSKLAARHADLAASARSLATLESDAAERRNLAALQSWGATPSTGGRPTSSSPSPLPLEDRIQRLDALLTSLWSLDSPGGKHHRLVRTFERWASSLADLEAARARAEDGADPSALLDDNADVRFGGGLDARWKEEAAALVRRLEGWDAQLRELEYGGDDDEDAAAGAGAGAGTDTTAQASSLKRMLDGCSSLVRDMLDELAVMEDIEAAAVERENEWIKKMNREGDDGRGRDTQRAGAIWRVI
ncbi:hypothetical protein CFIO01_09474 [Colletotrichum fioriniae PJ7]|uniref:Uncharacterized protein n=1 Tax=Colletotrichum fioriniae PJ7 TaxID=1445577 RepID=A0A010S516_9PEZI|nr:hypothetical protein CFIO01_09474 [Colletotrichum fioriniae PJ7]